MQSRHLKMNPLVFIPLRLSYGSGTPNEMFAAMFKRREKVAHNGKAIIPAIQTHAKRRAEMMRGVQFYNETLLRMDPWLKSWQAASSLGIPKQPGCGRIPSPKAISLSPCWIVICKTYSLRHLGQWYYAGLP
jgi:hypothetical protein